MKTSLICLLLLAAVACAAPRAGEMPGEKRVGMAEKMWEKMAEEKREEAENAVAAVKSDGESESRVSCRGPCYGRYDEDGCYDIYCHRDEDRLSRDISRGCWCCKSKYAPNC